MAYIGAVGLGIPTYQIKQKEVKEWIANHIFVDNKKIRRLLPVFDHAQVETRQIAADLNWFKEEHGWEETNQLYIKSALAYSLEAVDNCLQQLDTDYEEIDAIIFVSSTGITTPSLDTYIMNERPFRDDVVRMPLWGLGCAGGAMGISRGYEWVSLQKDKNVLVICCELCSLTFQKEDNSTSNIVGTAIFGDGAAATLLVGSESRIKNRILGPKLEIRATNSKFKKDSTDIMGWKVTKTGFEVIFSKDIPKYVSTLWKEHVEQFLREMSLNPESIDTFVAHPGGRKVLEEKEKIPGINKKKLSYSYEVLRNHGNMSSATVMYVLAKWLKHGIEKNKENKYGLLSALGPGFSSELLLLKWGRI